MSVIPAATESTSIGFPIFLTAYDPSDLPGGSLDPLGFERGYLFRADKILPALTNVADRPQYFSVLCAGALIGDVDISDPPRPKRYHSRVMLDPARAGRDASRIADEVITHLVGVIGSSVRVTLEIEAEIPTGVPENVVRTVTENSRTLKFTSHGFESE
jgi:hypothetical protein